MTNGGKTGVSYRGIGLAGRFAIAGGVLAVVLGAAGTTIDAGLRQIQGNLQTASDVAQPLAAAAFAMEINTIGAGMGLVNYLLTPSAGDRERFEDSREGFRQFLQSYRRLATTDRQRELAARIGAHHDDYREMGEFLLAAKDGTVREITALTAALRGFDRTLADEFEDLRVAGTRRGATITVEVEELERAFISLPLLLAGNGWNDQHYEQMIAAALEDIRRRLTTLADAVPERLVEVRNISGGFDTIEPRIEALVRTQREMAVTLKRFIAVRNDIESILHEEVQVPTSEMLGVANDNALREVQKGRLTLAGILIALLAALTAMFVYIEREVVQPINRLVDYSMDVARGDLSRQPDLRGTAEIGILARSGAKMVKTLQASREIMARDLAEREKMQESLNRSARMAAVGQLSGGIAHDFNNMLMVMGGYADRATRNSGDREIVETTMKEIRATIGKAAVVIRRLSIFSGRRALEAQVFQIARLKRDIDSLARPTIGKEYVIECDFRDSGARVKCDTTELSQVVLNLIINAGQASTPGGKIKISVDTTEVTADSAHSIRPPVMPGRYVVVAVADAGAGIPDAVVPHIFEPYFTTRPDGSGTGLGLASAYGFASQSGGGVSFTTKLGEGTTFYVYLPVTELAAEVLTAQSPDMPRGQGETILLVDDDDCLLELTREILVELGYNVIAAARGFSAVEIADDSDLHIDLLLSDVVMPVMNGIEACEIIKHDRPELPVVFMSGDTKRFGDVTLPENAKFLEKPITTPVLASTLRCMLTANGVKSMREKHLSAG